MSDYQDKVQDTVETADALEAVAVFRAWKNLFLSILIVCLILIQLVFWWMDTGMLSPTEHEPRLSLSVTPGQEPNISEVAQVLTTDPNQADPNQTIRLAAKPKNTFSFAGMSESRLDQVLRIANAVAILAGILYCAILLFSINLTVVGRLGGVQHISRAFFLSLVLLILLIPWQTLFDTVTVGVLFRVQDIIDGRLTKAEGLYPMILYYLRFCGYWLVVFVLAVLSQVRCARWSKSMLRRMELI